MEVVKHEGLPVICVDAPSHYVSLTSDFVSYPTHDALRLSCRFTGCEALAKL